MRSLVTGATGFVGRHLVRHLLELGDEVWGLVRRAPAAAVPFRPVTADLRDGAAIERALGESLPERIFHLAASTYVPDSFRDPWATFEVNVGGTIRLLDAAARRSPPPAVLLVGSSEEYGAVGPGDLPIKETTPLRPLNPYGVSKVSAGLLGRYYARGRGLRVVVVRAFNHAGPGQRESFVLVDFSRQIAEMERGLRPKAMALGNLDAVRDYTDVRDVVRAHVLALERGEGGEIYNVASGKGRRIGEALDILRQIAELEIEVTTDPAKFRLTDAPVLIGDSTKFRDRTGWRPEIPFEQTLRDVLDLERARLAPAP